eukprot:RCo029454
MRSTSGVAGTRRVQVRIRGEHTRGAQWSHPKTATGERWNRVMQNRRTNRRDVADFARLKTSSGHSIHIRTLLLKLHRHSHDCALGAVRSDSLQGTPRPPQGGRYKPRIVERLATLQLRDTPLDPRHRLLTLPVRKQRFGLLDERRHVHKPKCHHHVGRRGPGAGHLATTRKPNHNACSPGDHGKRILHRSVLKCGSGQRNLPGKRHGGGNSQGEGDVVQVGVPHVPHRNLKAPMRSGQAILRRNHGLSNLNLRRGKLHADGPPSPNHAGEAPHRLLGQLHNAPGGEKAVNPTSAVRHRLQKLRVDIRANPKHGHHNALLVVQLRHER